MMMVITTTLIVLLELFGCGVVVAEKNEEGLYQLPEDDAFFGQEWGHVFLRGRTSISVAHAAARY